MGAITCNYNEILQLLEGWADRHKPDGSYHLKVERERDYYSNTTRIWASVTLRYKNYAIHVNPKRIEECNSPMSVNFLFWQEVWKDINEKSERVTKELENISSIIDAGGRFDEQIEG